MFCENCGNKVVDGAKFCGVCGAAITQGQPAEQPQYQAAQPEQPNVYQAQQGYPYQSQQGAQGYSTGSNPLMDEYYRQVNGAPQPESDPAYGAAPQPERYSAEPQMAAVKPVKKRSKLLPIGIAAGSVAVVAAAGVLVFNANKASFAHMAKGDAGYAHALMMGYAENIAGSKAAESAVTDAVSAVQTSMSANSSFNDLTYGSDYGALDSSFGVNRFQAKALETVSESLNTMTGGKGISVTLSGNIEPDDKLVELLETALSEQNIDVSVDELMKEFNSSDVSVAAKAGDGAYEYRIGSRVNGSDFLAAQVRYEEDGELTIVFPGISDKGIQAELPEFSIGETEKEIAAFDTAKFIKSFSENTKELFENFSYDYSSGKEEVGDVSFSGMIMEITLDQDDLYDLAIAFVDTVREDDDLVAVLADSTDNTSSEIKADLKDARDSLKEEKSNSSSSFKVKLKAYINNDSTISGFDVKATDKNGLDANAVYLSDGVNAEGWYEQNGVKRVKLSVEGKSASEGTASIDITGELDPYDNYGYGRCAVKIDYKNLGEMEYFGRPALKGEFEVSISSGLADALFYYTDSELLDIIKGSKVMFSALPSGSGMALSFGADVKDYGKAVLTAVIDSASGEVAPKPGSSYTLVTGEDQTDLDDLYSDFMDYIKDFCDKSKLVGSVYYPTMVGYQASFNVTSANTIAVNAKDRTTEFLAKMDASAKGYTGDTSDLRILVENGVWTMSAPGGSNDWRDRTDHWGRTADANNITGQDSQLVAYLADNMSDVTNGYFEIHIYMGKVLGVTCVFKDYDKISALPTADNFVSGTWDGFDSSMDGLVNGVAVGTAPVLSSYKYFSY